MTTPRWFISLKPAPAVCFANGNETIKRLSQEPILDGTQRTQLEKLSVPDVFSFFSICYDSINKKRDLLTAPDEIRPIVIRYLAVSLVGKDQFTRADAIRNLLLVKSEKRANDFLVEVAESYPLPAIMERAAQLMIAPALPEECPISGYASLSCPYILF